METKQTHNTNSNEYIYMKDHIKLFEGQCID